jgi:hypothetical protein
VESRDKNLEPDAHGLISTLPDVGHARKAAYFSQKERSVLRSETSWTMVLQGGMICWRSAEILCPAIPCSMAS